MSDDLIKTLEKAKKFLLFMEEKSILTGITLSESYKSLKHNYFR
jgi:hypothetical protein